MTVGVKREPPDDAAAGPSLSAGPPNPGGAGARIKQPAPLIAPAAPEINRHRKQAFVDSEWLKRRMAETGACLHRPFLPAFSAYHLVRLEGPSALRDRFSLGGREGRLVRGREIVATHQRG